MDSFDYETIIHIIGKFGCNKTTLCTLIETEVKNKISPDIKFEFNILFETQFEFKRTELIKDDITILEYPSSPIIFLFVNLIFL